MNGIEIITAGRHKTSRWAGGSTTELAVFPPDSSYAERNFICRLSSAAIETETSGFTILSGYTRYIMSLDREIALRHDGGEEIRLAPFAVHVFDGGQNTVSRGLCTDFNLMLKHGLEGGMRALRSGEIIASDAARFTWIYALSGLTARHCEGGDLFTLERGDLLSLGGGGRVEITQAARDICAVTAFVL